MRPLLRLILLIPLGFIAACLAAGLFLVAAAFGVGRGGAGPESAWALLVLAGGVAAWAGALACVPAAVAIFLAEAFGWRSMLFYLLLGAGLGLAVRLLFHPAGAVVSATDAQLFAATGAVAGFTYWGIAGRHAGLAVAERPRHP